MFGKSIREQALSNKNLMYLLTFEGKLIVQKLEGLNSRNKLSKTRGNLLWRLKWFLWHCCQCLHPRDHWEGSSDRSLWYERANLECHVTTENMARIAILSLLDVTLLITTLSPRHKNFLEGFQYPGNFFWFLKFCDLWFQNTHLWSVN